MLKYLACMWRGTEVKDGSECMCGWFGKPAEIFVCVYMCACFGSMISESWGVQNILQSLKLYLIIKKKENELCTYPVCIYKHPKISSVSGTCGACSST